MAGKRRGFFLIEVAFALAIIGIIVVGMLRDISLQKANLSYSRALNNARMIAMATAGVYRTVVEDSAPVCAPSGWANPQCDATIPFPVLENGYLKVYVDSDLSVKNRLENQIKTIITSAGCVYSGKDTANGADVLKFMCLTPKITALSYTLSDGSTTSTFSTGGVDPMHFPVSVTLSFTVDLSNGETVKKTETYDISYLRQDLIRKSAERIQTVASALETYYTTRLSTEVDMQPYPDGLHSTEDFYVPWQWQVLATDGQIYKTCQDQYCSGIDDWNTGNPDFDDVITDVTKRLLQSGAYPLSLDGFMYEWRVILVGNGCSGDLSSCTADNNKPPTPNKTVTGAGWYWDVYSVKPPFFTWIVSSAPSCLKNDSSPDWCRTRIVYSQ